jgi:hypothetical protein
MNLGQKHEINLTKGAPVRMASNGITFIPNFVKTVNLSTVERERERQYGDQ